MKQDLGNNVFLEMVRIPGGSFMMGSPPGESKSTDYERPQHDVKLSDFFMGRYPITQEQWRIVANWEKVNIELDPMPSYFQDDFEGITRWKRPVEQVTWEEAVEFCKRLSKKTVQQYRLPTEAEWEYACRAGTTTPFHFDERFVCADLINFMGVDIFDSCENEYLTVLKRKKIRKQTTPVGSFPKNGFGLYDMHGNIAEWCEDIFYDYKSRVQSAVSWRFLLLSNQKPPRLLRGGSWINRLGSCRSASRDWQNQDEHSFAIGFRVVCSSSYIS